MVYSENAELRLYKALVFDCYGTLIDWEAGMTENLHPLFGQKTCPTRERVFETLGKYETKLQQENKTMLYPDVLAHAYSRTADELRLGNDSEAAEAFGMSVGDWPSFPDSSSALSGLKALGLRLVILSNVDTESFSRTRRKLETDEMEFDAVYVAEDIGSYKPDLRNFQYALEHLDVQFGIKPDEVISVANSKYHDIEPAHQMGLKAVWITRASADPIMGVSGREPIQPDWEFPDMESFASEMETQHAQRP